MTFSETTAVASLALTVIGSTGTAVFLIGRWIGKITIEMKALAAALQTHMETETHILGDHAKRIERLETGQMEQKQ